MSTLLEVEHLSIVYPVRSGWLGRSRRLQAVNDVSFEVATGETVGLVGESGCGKSTIARALLGLEKPCAGTIRFANRDVTRAAGDELRFLRRGVQMVFQDPYGSLNPRLRIGAVLAEVLAANTSLRPLARQARVLQLLELVGLGREHINRFPHQLSGGQRQRVGIARALAVEPKLILADEPVSALDVSVQAQVINLFLDLQTRLELAYLFIAHDLAMVEYLSDRVLVMYLGRIVEAAPTASLFRSPRHPYTRALLAAIPDVANTARRAAPNPLAGDVPSPLAPPSGCAFHPRCPLAQEICKRKNPALESHPGDPAHQTACFFAG
jgi:oligopeptide/dipeptide ABC transporter ATP-binding protein